jgi:hypothetical protein
MRANVAIDNKFMNIGSLRRLAEFEGIGPKTVEIFMREAAKVIF